MMSILINHCWCSESNWGGVYHCRVIVTIQRIPYGKTYYDGVTDDWKNLVDDQHFNNGPIRLKPEVMDWLKANIADRSVEKECEERGWCVGTDRYNEQSALSFNVFFSRQQDALKFVKKWSTLKLPVDLLNYFKDTRKRYDFTTKRLKPAPRYAA